MKENRKKKAVIVGAAVIVICIVVFALLAGGNSSAKRITELLDFGNKYLTEQDYEEAVAAFQEVIEIDSKCEEAYHGMADVYVAMDDYESAINILQQGIEQTGSEELTAYLEEIKETYARIQEEVAAREREVAEAAAEAERKEEVGIIAKVLEEDTISNAELKQNENGDVLAQTESTDQDDGIQSESETILVMKVIDEKSLKDEASQIFDNTGSMAAAEEVFDNALAEQSGNAYACDQIVLARMWFYFLLFNGYHEQIVALGNGISPENLEYGQRLLYYELMKLSSYELGDMDKYNEYSWLGYQLCVQGSD